VEHGKIKPESRTRQDRAVPFVPHSVPTCDVGKKELDKRTLLRTLISMTTITATSARNKLYSLIDEANESHIPIQITGKRGNAVLVSEDDWRAISETIHLSTIPGMVDSIKKGMEQKVEECSDSLEW
jgi:antitoxin YefM